MNIKKMFLTVIIAMFIGSCLGGWLVQENYSNVHEYALTTVVVELDQENDEVICADFNGNEWAFTEIGDWMIGDIAAMIMDNNNTDIIYDDEIVSVKYNGRINGFWNVSIMK